MTHLSTSIPPVVVQTSEDCLASLEADLLALGVADRDAARDAALARPSILRRIAGYLALRVPAGTDRLVAQEQDAALAAAVALHSGLPFALMRSNNDSTEEFRGELHASEQIVVVAMVEDSKLEALIEATDRRGASVRRTAVVLGEATQGTATTALFKP